MLPGPTREDPLAIADPFRGYKHFPPTTHPDEMSQVSRQGPSGTEPKTLQQLKFEHSKMLKKY